MTIQEVQTGFHQDQSVSDQSGLSAVHVLGALVQVLDHTGHPTDPALTVQPLSAAWNQNQSPLRQNVTLNVINNLSSSKMIIKRKHCNKVNR